MKLELYDKKIDLELMDLLLTADPDKNSILSYLIDSKVFVCQTNGELVGIAVLKETGGIFELKNIAVTDKHQGKGIAKSMITELKSFSKEAGAKVLEVGTGNSSLFQLALYQKCGFRMYRVEADFFKSYPERIFENGILCIDKVWLRVEL